jgi:hypothetical protein
MTMAGSQALPRGGAESDFSAHGLEYRNELFDLFLTQKGVITTYAAPYAHEQNGLTEKFNRTLLNKIKALLI